LPFIRDVMMPYLTLSSSGYFGCHASALTQNEPASFVVTVPATPSTSSITTVAFGARTSSYCSRYTVPAMLNSASAGPSPP
jgi:hypothetical protein